MIRETREAYIFQKFVCQRFLKSDRRLTRKVLIQREKKIIGLRRCSEKITVDRKSSENVRAKSTLLTIEFSAVTTSS